MITIGTTISLELEEMKEFEKKKTRFRCRLVDRTDSIYVIDYPINEETNKPSFFFDGTEFRASFIADDDAVYAFDTEIIGRRKGNIPVLLLKNPGKEKYLRIQRRNYVRVETTVDAAIYPIEKGFSPFRTVTLDLSGGGCSIVIPQDQTLPEVGELNLWLVLHMQSGDIAYVKAYCKIVRVYQPRPDARLRASLQFLNVDERDQQKIIRFCFERQLALRRKNEA
ncbi:flagellar brake protein [Halalkalibacter alkalisediminis]|uniref:Flagellar brake protein n=1 Tax=Halalkalibacter alkalisediminis TaxID=935616 RepID=A0ABV6NGG0_9BACI|nr:flagellar brake domain-containing protein [Halalkalibacter alkalisediminis]